MYRKKPKNGKREEGGKPEGALPRKSTRQAKFDKRIQLESADCGKIREPKKPKRRKKCENNLEAFCLEYLKDFPYGFYMPLVKLHKKMLGDFQEVSKYGGRVAFAAPRGGGKTTCCLAAILKGLLYGHVKSDVYVCETTPLALIRLDLIKKILRKNPKIHEDFPEVTIPVRHLGGKPQRQLSQTYTDKNGERQLTEIVWKSDVIALPKIEGSVSSGARIIVGGIQSGMRGLLDDVGRPDRVIIDDPQGDDAAVSTSIKMRRRKIIGKALGELGSQYGNLAMIMLVTIIEADDIADEFTDRKRRPEWVGRRYKFLSKKPDSEKAKKYIAMRQEDQEKGDRYGRRAHKFYVKNRTTIERGIKSYMPFSYRGKHVIEPPKKKTDNIAPDGTELECSAIEKALNVLAQADGEEVFSSEYQNEPYVDESQGVQLSTGKIMERNSGIRRGVIPIEAQFTTCHVDVHPEILYWLMASWNQDYTGCIIDYGVWPEQNRKQFMHTNLDRTLQQLYPDTNVDGAIASGLRHLLNFLATKSWEDTGQSKRQLDMILVDRGYKADIVSAVCRQAGRPYIIPSRGVPVTAKNVPFEDTRVIKGTMIGCHWRMPPAAGKVRYVNADVNWWKTFIRDRLQMPPGVPGSITLPGVTEKNAHLAEHLSAEKFVQTFGQGRYVDEWLLLPGRDNHWFDNLVGCAVAASLRGLRVPGTLEKRKKRRRKTQKAKYIK